MDVLQNYLPNLFIPGAERSGTTTLYGYLRQHPEICMSPRKEPNIFWRKDRSLNDYKTLFWGCAEKKFRGDASTPYMTLPEVASRIKETVADPYFIFVFRNPAERAWSHYWRSKGNWRAKRMPGSDDKGFREVFLADMELTPSIDSFNQTTVTPHYFHMGLYGKWLQHYLDLFNSDRILILEFSEMAANPERALRNVFDFLELDRLKNIQEPDTNRTRIVRFPLLLRYYARSARAFAGTIGRALPRPIMNRLIHYNSLYFRFLYEVASHGRPPKLSDHDRKWISDFYEDDVELLRAMTGLKFTAWNGDFPPSTGY